VLRDVTLDVAAGETLAVVALPAAASTLLGCAPGSMQRRRAPSPQWSPISGA